MKTLFSIPLLVCVTFSAFAQERAMEHAEFDRVLKTSYDVWTVWKGKAFRKTVSVESRGPAQNYELKRVVEFDGNGASRAVYNEYADGKELRLTREIIGVGATKYVRDIGRGSWWIRRDAEREELHVHLAYAPDPLEVQAVRSHFVRSQFDRTVKENRYAYVGIEQTNNGPVSVYKATERIKGVEKKSGLLMETDAVMKYWFGQDGMMVRSESVSDGRVGNDVYHLKITATWELDPSISITAPVRPPT